MISFFQGKADKYYLVEHQEKINEENSQKLSWLFGEASPVKKTVLKGFFIGPRKEMITPWSTNAVEITQNMGIQGIQRIEEFFRVPGKDAPRDPMLQSVYENISQDIFHIDIKPEPVRYIDDIAAYNIKEGLALSVDEIGYLESVSRLVGRKLTDSEVFGFSQVNSEHCRHKIFNGTFILDSEEQPESLFELIKKTTRQNLNRVISAYKDNVAFIDGPELEQFAPASQDKPDYFECRKIPSILSLKAETHNFPTTVEPFNGASTGSGGEIRDRMAGGKGSIPLAGTAVYMTSYPRTENNRNWEKNIPERKWLYQTPAQILIKASNGASDFGNKFGQPLICGSLLTFEHQEGEVTLGFDKVIMLAGGVGTGKKQDAVKDTPGKDDRVVVMGGDNYRIGMGGGAVSSVDTGEYSSNLELNAVQRANPEMQKRVYNALRALAELNDNPIVSIHDHGAGGHLNCLSELVEETGGVIEIEKLPLGDPTLSMKEIIGNESQERMGLVMKEKDMKLLENIARRERAPLYDAGKITGDHRLTFKSKGENDPIDLKLEYLFGKPPRTILRDKLLQKQYQGLKYQAEQIEKYLEDVLQLEGVACKDWLTNKVDRSVTGRVAHQQTAGPLQLPLNDVSVMALDYTGYKGIATSIGHAPVAGIIDSGKGSVLAVAEALTNMVWAPLEYGLEGVSLSANWMWPAKNPGEDARLYRAVKSMSDFCLALGINIPTGKDSLSMTQKYPDGKKVMAPGTVIVSTVGEVNDFRKTITPVVKAKKGSHLVYIDFSSCPLELGGSSLGQALNKIGEEAPIVKDPAYFINAFNTLQNFIKEEKILAGHDVSAGGLVTCLLEMLFADNQTGANIKLDSFKEDDPVKILFSENPAVVVQTANQEELVAKLEANGVHYHLLGEVNLQRDCHIALGGQTLSLDVNKLRDTWYKSSYLLDQKQSGEKLALERFKNFKGHSLNFTFPDGFKGQFADHGLQPSRKEKSGIKAAIIREKGVNGDREMAYFLYLAGFDVKDVHMTDLISGRETLEDIHFIVFVGGFSNSDVLGSAKGWAGAFLYNPKAKEALENFYAREDTLSLGICNGCQLMVELGLLYPGKPGKAKMQHNDSGKFESHFLNVDILENHSVMLKSLSGSRLGIWVAHGEGKFTLQETENEYNIPVKYTCHGYPGNPNGSAYNAAALVSDDGRHLAMMPHLERAILPWQWAYYPENRKNDQLSPWLEAFANAKKWVEKM